MHNLLCFQFSNEWNNIFVAVCICLTLSIHIIWRWWKYAGEVTMHISDRLTGIAKQGIPPTHWPSEFWSVYLQTFFFSFTSLHIFLIQDSLQLFGFFWYKKCLENHSHYFTFTYSLLFLVSHHPPFGNLNAGRTMDQFKVVWGWGDEGWSSKACRGKVIVRRSSERKVKSCLVVQVIKVFRLTHDLSSWWCPQHRQEEHHLHLRFW